MKISTLLYPWKATYLIRLYKSRRCPNGLNKYQKMSEHNYKLYWNDNIGKKQKMWQECFQKFQNRLQEIKNKVYENLIWQKLEIYRIYRYFRCWYIARLICEVRKLSTFHSISNNRVLVQLNLASTQVRTWAMTVLKKYIEI